MTNGITVWGAATLLAGLLLVLLALVQVLPASVGFALGIALVVVGAFVWVLTTGAREARTARR